uniref:HERV-H LTR-associating 2b, tandem duplicate 2 n=1 Tax=Amphiprion percula TaxID=161767 RepID=A0A3P8SJM1_AMPPE
MKTCRNMIKMKVSVFLVKFLWILTVCTGDTEVSCVFTERCILLCSFQVAPQVVIHWTHLEAGLGVHSYYDNQDQLQNQHHIYRNRTSLFKAQIPRGNASLQLTGVKVQDEGRYQCFISTINGNKDSFINVKVDAPVHKINIQQVENRITCSSEGIYPEPELTWSTRPPSNINLHNTITVQQNEQQLYSISSSLILSHSDTDLVHICTISTPTNRKRAAWRKLTPINGSITETIITCAASNFSFSHLLWRFNHSQMILNQSRTDGRSTVSEEWRQQVKDVSKSGDITLQDLSSEQEGIYTCELSNAEEMLITDTSVKISGGNSVHVGGIIGGVIGAVLVLTAAAVSLLLYYKKKKGQQENGTRRSSGAETM